MTRQTAAAAVAIPEDLLLAWADASSEFAAALRAGVMSEDLYSASVAYSTATLPLMMAIEELRAEMLARRQRDRLTLVQGGRQ